MATIDHGCTVACVSIESFYRAGKITQRSVKCEYIYTQGMVISNIGPHSRQWDDAQFSYTKWSDAHAHMEQGHHMYCNEVLNRTIMILTSDER